MKFSGKIGFAKTEEVQDRPGVWKNVCVEKDAVGDYIKNYYRNQNGSKVNDDIVFASSISIIADPYAMANYNFIKYVRTVEGIAWKVESVEIQYPRLILTLGGEYNAQ